MSMMWRNCERRPPLSLIRAGQETIIGLRVPPKWLATCLVHWKGAFMACAQADGKWLKCLGPPSSSMALMLSCHFSEMPLKKSVFAEGALEAAFGAGSVVPGDVDDEGVVAAGELLHGIDDAAELVVALCAVAGEDLHHARIEALLIGVQ